MHPDDIGKTHAAIESLGQGRELADFENRLRRRDGTYRWLSWSAHPVPDWKVILVSARDVGARKEMEQNLRLGHERSRSLIERALDAFVSIDMEGRITDWNLQAESIFGWSRAEALGRFLHETIIPPGYREGHLRGIRHLQATGGGSRAEQADRALRVAP